MMTVRFTLGCLALACAATCGASTARASDATDRSAVSRYPFDPACAWGRLADGRGMVIRCLTEAESAQLAANRPPPSAASVAVPPKPAPGAATVGASAEPTEKRPPEGYTGPVEVDVVNVVADEGNLPIARRKLRAPREKYARCVSDNGGLLAEVGEVTVRFLVRELGRAEGTSVEKRQGLSDAAAKCIAAVVDRRPVGTPEAPMVGATAVIRVTKQAQRRTESAAGR